MKNKNEISILIVEDEDIHAILILDTLKNNHITNDVSRVTNGKEALKFLKKQGNYANSKTPNLILLDLHMPLMGGIDTLTEIRKDKNLRDIPVMILTSSDDSNDIITAHNLLASCYITKPVNFEDFLKEIELMDDFTISKENHMFTIINSKS